MEDLLLPNELLISLAERVGDEENTPAEVCK